MKTMKYDYSKCNKPEKCIYDNQICGLQAVWTGCCTIDKKECHALIK